MASLCHCNSKFLKTINCPLTTASEERFKQTIKDQRLGQEPTYSYIAWTCTFSCLRSIGFSFIV